MEGDHFRAANKRVKQLLTENPNLRHDLGLNQGQYEFFMKPDPMPAESPPGLTWHHHQDVGKMQLVDQDLHARYGHVGGMEIWGGGR